MLPEPLTRLIDAARPALASHAVHLPERPTGIVLCGRHVSVLVYDEHARHPVVLLKLARPEDTDALVAEHEALERLAGVAGPDMHVPRALALVPTEQRLILAQTVVPGVSLFHSLRNRFLARERFATAQLGQAIAWLRRFQHETADHSARFPVATAVDALRAAIDAAGHFTPARSRALNTMAVRATDSGAERLPVVWAHGDFWPGNILRGDGEIGVIDWAHLAANASPSTDLTFLILTWAHATRWRDRSWSSAEQAFDRAFLEPGWFRDLTSRIRSDHLARLGIGADAYDLSLVLDLHHVSTRHDAPVGPPGDWYQLILNALDRAE